MGPPVGRCSLDERQPIRMEDAHQWTLTGIAGQGPAGEELPALAGAVEGGQQDAALGELELHPGTLLAVANQVAIVAGAKRAAGEAEVDRLQQVRLAGSVGPVDDDDARGERGARVRQVPETTALDCADDHCASYTLRRIGITR